MVGTARDTVRNFSIAAWAIRKHIDYVSTFTFKPNTGDKALDAELEWLSAESGRAYNFDAARRHSRRRWLRIAESNRTVDGDGLVIPLPDGRYQFIEGDRITKPRDCAKATPQMLKMFENAEHGVLLKDGGEAQSFIVCKRSGGLSAQFEFEAVVDAALCYFHGYFTRTDQVRGISPLSTSINKFRDIYEGLDYAQAKLKVQQLFALAIYRQMGNNLPSTAPVQDVEDGEGKSGDDEVNTAYDDIDFSKGALLLDLEPGDEAKFLEGSSPSFEMQGFTTLEIAIALKSLDIPLCFYDEGHTNYSGQRQAWIQYEQSSASKRADNLEMLEWMTRLDVIRWIAQGKLILPRSVDVARFISKLTWLPISVPWVDPLKEVTADLLAIEGRLETRSDIIKRRTGRSFREVIDETKGEEKYADDQGVELVAVAGKGAAAIAAADAAEDTAAKTAQTGSEKPAKKGGAESGD